MSFDSLIVLSHIIKEFCKERTIESLKRLRRMSGESMDEEKDPNLTAMFLTTSAL